MPQSEGNGAKSELPQSPALGATGLSELSPPGGAERRSKHL